MTNIVLLVADEFDRNAIIRSVTTQCTVACCGSAAALSSMLHRGVNAIVYEPGLGLCDNPELVDDIGRCGTRLVLRTRLTPAAIDEVITIVHRLPYAGVSLRARSARNDETIRTAEMLGGSDCGPVAFVLDRVADPLATEARAFVTAALALGRGRSDLEKYAATCGVATRTCQAAHQRCRLPSPHRLLGWGQAFWAVWRIERWNMTCKQTATAGGFPQASAMSSALQPIITATPLQLASAGRIKLLVDRFAEELSR